MQFNVPHTDRNKSGVYIIRNSVNNKVLVGSTKAFRARYRTYCALLRKGVYPSVRLQNFVTEHSINVLSFDMVCLCPLELLLETEQHYINLYQSCHEEFGFNRAPYAGSSKGLRATPETKAKLSASVKNRPPEVHAKNSMALTGRSRTDEVKAKISATKRKQGRTTILTEESKAKISTTLKGNKASPEARANMAVAAKIRANTPEAKARSKERFGTPEAKAAFIEKMRQGREAKRATK